MAPSPSESWGRGGIDLDDPFPVFAQVRAEHPVLKVRLADGTKRG